MMHSAGSLSREECYDYLTKWTKTLSKADSAKQLPPKDRKIIELAKEYVARGGERPEGLTLNALDKIDLKVEQISIGKGGDLRTRKDDYPFLASISRIVKNTIGLRV